LARADRFQDQVRSALVSGFHYERDRLEADTIRLMTCWLEKTFLVHQDRIPGQLRAMAAGATPRPL
jgi:hypothetical protein